jgi:hypothetical protein
VVVLLGIEISIIALASAASAASKGPDWEPRQTPPPITRYYHIERVIDARRWLPSADPDFGLEPAESALNLSGPLTRLREVHKSAVRAPETAVRGPRTPWTRITRTWTVRRPGLAAGRTLTVEQAPAAESNLKQSRPEKGQRPHVDLQRVKPRYAMVHLSHNLASHWLHQEGLRTKSSGNCANRHVGNCTSLDHVRTSTIARLIDLRRQSGCPVLVTGGTETGHAPGRYSHSAGYKLDITHNSCIDRYITKNHSRSGIRSDGSALYRSPTGTTFANESSHWDILFR